MKPHGRKLVLPPSPAFSFYFPPSPSVSFNFPTSPPVSNEYSFVNSWAFPVVMIMIVIAFIGCYICCRLCSDQDSSGGTTSSPALDHSPRSNQCNGLDQMVVRALPMHSYSADAKYQADCAICLNEFEEGEAMKMIPFCQHVFHPECINSWLSSHVTCPVCRSTQIFDELKAGEASGVGD